MLALAGSFAAGAESKIDFQRDIRPIISDRCYKCHGPDEDKRKAKLRLDVREDALKPAKSGDRAIVPGKVDESELVTRIFSTDEKDIMPPPEIKKPLSEEQKRSMSAPLLRPTAMTVAKTHVARPSGVRRRRQRQGGQAPAPQQVGGQLERRGGDIREFSSQEVANMLWACGTKRGKPGERLIGQLERWVEPISGELNSQNIAITLWAYATRGRKPWRMMCLMLPH
jgi:hypothetical protein